MKLMKFLLSLTTLIFASFLFFPSAAAAAGLTLSSVGNYNPPADVPSQIWYTNTTITFTGTATAGSTVTATIDGVSEAAAVDSAGNWSYTKTFTAEDHQVTLASDSETISFTLTAGQTVPSDYSGSTASGTPTAGFVSPTLIFAISGTLLAVIGLVLTRKSLLKS
jgi:hypothetical protein